MKQELLLESYLKQLRLPCFAQSHQSLSQEAADTNLTYERYLLALAQEEVASRDAHRIERASHRLVQGVTPVPVAGLPIGAASVFSVT
jgi:DNA replication protein DnaC